MALIDQMTHQHALYTFVSIFDVPNLDLSANNVLDEVTKYIEFAWEVFSHFTSSPLVTSKLYLQRNNMFFKPEMISEFKRQWLRDCILKLEELGYSGWNIFEECFISKHDGEAKVEIFVRLMEAFLNVMKRNSKMSAKKKDKFLNDLIYHRKGELRQLFAATKGFHIRDRNGITPLLFAVSNGSKNVIEFFIDRIISKSEWGGDAEYMRSVLQAFLESVDSLAPDLDPDSMNESLLDCLLELDAVDVNHCSSNHTEGRQSYIAHEILRLRSLSSTPKESKPLLLKVLELLFSIDYDFANNTDESDQNILHFAITLRDREAVDLILVELNENASDDANSDLKTILNSKNKKGYVPLALALFGMDDKVAESLLRCPEQSYEWIWETRNGNMKWLQCLYNVMIRTKMKILDAIRPDVIALLFKFSKGLLEDGHQLGSTEKENEYKSHANSFKLWRAVVEALREYTAGASNNGIGTHRRNNQNLVQ